MIHTHLGEPHAPATVPEEIFNLLYVLLGRLRAYFDQTAAQFGLGPTEAKALLRLDGALPMRELAAELQCDASYVTDIADRLENGGLVTRTVDQNDRRVKNLEITDEGKRIRQTLHERLFANVPGVVSLSSEKQQALRDLLLEVVSAAA